MYSRILLPTDGSVQAEKAGEYTLSTADFTGADIIVLYVIDTYYLDALPQHDLREQLSEQMKEEGKQIVDSFGAKLKETQCTGGCTSINLITMIKEGNPAHEILKTIEEEHIDLVIIGKSGKQAIEKFLIGSTAEKVVRESQASVNVIS